MLVLNIISTCNSKYAVYKIVWMLCLTEVYAVFVPYTWVTSPHKQYNEISDYTANKGGEYNIIHLGKCQVSSVGDNRWEYAIISRHSNDYDHTVRDIWLNLVITGSFFFNAVGVATVNKIKNLRYCTAHLIM